MRRRLLTALALVALLVVAVAPVSAGTLYRYVDGRGVVHYSNVPVDARYVRVQPRHRIRRVRPPRSRAYDGVISLAATDHGVPPALVKAVIHAESFFDPRAVSRKGAQGLMQLMPKTASALGVRDPLHVEENVDGGVRYLRVLHDRYGDWTRALAAYNAGPTAVDRYGGVPPYRETRQYVDRVLTYYRRYHGDFSR